MLFRPVEPPQVTLVDVRLHKATLFEQRFFVELRIHNPNSFAIPIKGLQVNLDLHGQAFAHGVSNEQVKISAKESGILELEAVSTTLALVRQLNRLQMQGASTILPYRVYGKLQAMGRDNLSFDYTGEIDLAGLLGRL